MERRLEIVTVEPIDGFGIIVAFSDGTSSNYTVEQLANMHPNRSTSPKLVKAKAVLGNMIDTAKRSFSMIRTNQPH